MRLRPGAEHARDRSRLRHHLHPQRARAVRPRRSLGVRQLRRQLPRPQRRRRSGATAPTPTCSSTSRADRGSGATSTRGSRARSSSTPTRRSRSSRSRRRSRGTSSSSSGSITCSPSAPTSAPPASPIPVGDFTWHKTWQPVTLDDWRTERAARRPLHDGDDLADRELHRRRRQQGSGVREVHRPAVADVAAASSSPSTGRSSCCASTAGRPSTR